jgi:hypothetical protein
MFRRNEISLLPKTPTEKQRKQLRRFIEMQTNSADPTSQLAKCTYSEIGNHNSTNNAGCSAHSAVRGKSGSISQSVTIKTLPKLRNSSERRDMVPGYPRKSSSKMGKTSSAAKHRRQVFSHIHVNQFL